MRRGAPAIAAAWMYVCLAHPANGSDGPRWLKVTSANFELYTTAGERSGREAARYFEQVRGFFQQALGLREAAGPPVRMVIFRTDKEYAPYAPNEFASAFYLGAEDCDYIIMKSAAMEHFNVAVHEYTHLLVKHSGVRVPVWFNEGLAEFYSNLKPLGGKVVVGSVIPSHYAMLHRSRWIDLPALLAVEHDSPLYSEKSHAGLFYSECWALVHMLYLGKDYRSNLRGLLDGIKNGDSMAATFEKAYGKSVAQVQKDLEAYMNATRFDASIFDVKLPDKVDRPEVTESSPVEAGLVLANMQSNTRRGATEARESYERLGREAPKDWRIEQGLARLSRREHKIDEAMAHYARAVQLGSTDAHMYLDYGRVLRYGEKHAEAVAMLKRAAELEPDNQEARLELSLAYVVNDQYAEALEQFQAIKRVTPEQAFGYFHGMAYAYYRLDRGAEAREAAAKCRKYAKTPDQAARLDQLVEALNYEPHGMATHAKPAAVEGVLQRIDCTGGKIRLQIVSNGKPMWFAISDPNSVTMKNHGSAEFNCGPQEPRRVRIEYKPPDVVESLEYQE